MVPALAVAEALRSQGAEVAFVGGDRAEAQLVPQAGYPLHGIAVEGLSRTHPLRAAIALLRSATAVMAAKRIIAELRPQAVLGGGGYVAGPVGLAALLARLPLVLTEADNHLGLANRLLARGAHKVCLAFAPTDSHGAPLAIDDGRFVVTGRPIFPVRGDRERARARFEVALQARCVLVFGGSLGARSVNLAALDALPELVAKTPSPGLQVLHVCGRRDHPQLAGRELPAGYRLIDHLDLADFDEALAAADLVVARSGGSVFEIAAHGLPAILVPYPHAAADHQSANARWMSEAGAACVISDDRLEGRLLGKQVRELLADGERLSRMAAASRSLARPGAAQEVAEALLEAAGQEGARR